MILRDQVNDLLKQTSDLKLLQGDPGKVLGLAQTAHDLSKALSEPWPQITAYRLAQLKCRQPKKSVDMLKEIAELFEVASDGQTRSYGPLPRIYQLAVLHQLKSNDPERRDAYDQRINKVFRRAVEVMRIPSLVNETARKIRLQGDSFNMLELASFFLELPYDKLRGLADETPSQFDISGTWQFSKQ